MSCLRQSLICRITLAGMCLGLFAPGTRAALQETKDPPAEKAFDEPFREGERLFYEGNYERAKEKFHEAFLVPENTPQNTSDKYRHINRFGARLMEGKCYEYLDELDRALAIYHEVRRQGEQEGLRLMVADALHCIGGARYLKGEFVGAIDDLKQSEAICRMSNNCSSSGRSLIDIGVAYSALGNYSLAFKYLDDGLERVIVEHEGLKEQGRMEQTRALQALGNLERSLGNIVKAVDYYEKAVLIGREESGKPYNVHLPYNRAYLVEALIDMGTLYGQLHGYARAQAAFEEALEISRGSGTRRLIARSLVNLGNLARGRRELGKAVDYHHQALSLAEEAALRPTIGQSLAELGWDSSQMGKTREAIEFFHRALDAGGDAIFSDVKMSVYLGLAQAYETLGDSANALEHYDLTVESLERVRLEALSEERKIGFWQAKQATFERVVSLLNRLHQQDPQPKYDAQAFDYAEKAKARAFLDLLAEGRVHIERGLSQEVRREEQAIDRETSRVRKALLTEDLPKAQAAKLEKDLARAEERLEEFHQRIRLSQPAYAALKYPKPLNLKEVQDEILDRETLLLEFMIGEDHSYLWAVSKSECRMVVLPPRGDIEQQVRAYRRLITTAPKGEESFARCFLYGRQLYNRLLRPIEDTLVRYKQLVIVPDGILHYLPFETLVQLPGRTNTTQPRFLISNHHISYSSSASVWSLAEATRDLSNARDMELLAYADPILKINPVHRGGASELGHGETPLRGEKVRERNSHSQSVEVAANFHRERGMKLEPLPYSRREVHSIAALYPASATEVRIGRAATESSLKRQPLGRFKTLHFATHGLIDEKAPARSGIVLSLVDPAERDEDGILEMSEIFNLDLNADLVVVSACQSGLGKLVRGEGLIGLSRAFMYAGAPSVVVSLWNVRDSSTAELMKNFYRHLRAGKNKSEALRQAKLDMLGSDTPAYRFPYFWAPFVLIGKS